MRHIVRTVALIAISGAGLGLLAVPADAHVTVHSYEATQGGSDAEVVFRVPNEEAGAKTVKIEVDLPTDTPMIGVSASPPAGWTATTTDQKLAKPVVTDDGTVNSAVARIVYSGGSISGDQYVDFPVTVGLLPSVPQLTFKVLQTYSDGNVVRWIEQGTAGAAAPQNPAPTLTLAPAASGGASATAAPVGQDVGAAVAAARAGADEAKKAADDARNLASSMKSAGATSNQVNTARGLALVAIVLALIGAGTGGVALGRRSKNPAVPPSPTYPPRNPSAS